MLAKRIYLCSSRHFILPCMLLFVVCVAMAQASETTIDSVRYAITADILLKGTTSKSIPKASVVKSTATIVAGAGLWVATFAWVDEPVQRHLNAHSSLVGDKISAVVEPLGRQHYMLPLAGVAFATGMITKDTNLEKTGILAASSIMVSAGITEVLKHQFHRHRPNSGDDNLFLMVYL